MRLLALAYSRVALAGIPGEAERLQVAEGVLAALVLGMKGPPPGAFSALVAEQQPSAAARAAAPGSGEHPLVDRAADRRAVAGSVGENVLPPLSPERIQPMAASPQQLIALPVAQLDCYSEALCGMPCPSPAPASHQEAGLRCIPCLRV